jgi:hypothetical protein
MATASAFSSFGRRRRSASIQPRCRRGRPYGRQAALCSIRRCCGRSVSVRPSSTGIAAHATRSPPFFVALSASASPFMPARGRALKASCDHGHRVARRTRRCRPPYGSPPPLRRHSYPPEDARSRHGRPISIPWGRVRPIPLAVPPVPGTTAMLQGAVRL